MKVIKAKLPILIIVLFSFGVYAQSVEQSEKSALEAFSKLFSGTLDEQERALDHIEGNWDNKLIPMVLEVMYLHRNPAVSGRLLEVLEKNTDQYFRFDLDKWYQWVWSKPEHTIEYYSDFKADIYRYLDPRFEKYFEGRYNSKIRLDEIRWGGVLQDGIPPLRNPIMIAAEEADYLTDSNIVFGIEVNGDIRAYPKRILAWHEMFTDIVGGQPVCGVYCTLCGTVILYNTIVEGKFYNLGTSGFLYRSNKLMYDQTTQSLWNTVWGEPVLGPLVDKGIKLDPMSVVTTTWGEWRKRHPDTKVLSLETGHRRNYGEGVAYKNYFSTDELMFITPFSDNRLKNKDEVLALRFKENPEEQLAISVNFLKKNPVYYDRVGTKKFIVLTDETGANRVYDANDARIISFDGEHAMDQNGDKWKLYEDRLEGENGSIMRRLPYHRAFWFGWLAAYPNTRLVK